MSQQSRTEMICLLLRVHTLGWRPTAITTKRLTPCRLAQSFLRAFSPKQRVFFFNCPLFSRLHWSSRKLELSSGSCCPRHIRLISMGNTTCIYSMQCMHASLNTRAVRDASKGPWIMDSSPGHFLCPRTSWADKFPVKS